MPKKPEKKVAKPKKQPKYKVSIEVNGETTDLKGDDVLTVLQKFEKPAIIKTDFVVKIDTKSKTVVDFVGVHEARKLLSNTTALELFAHNLTKRLG